MLIDPLRQKRFRWVKAPNYVNKFYAGVCQILVGLDFVLGPSGIKLTSGGSFGGKQALVTLDG